MEDNKKEDKEIKRLEKLLSLDKKKKVPSQFSHEGLDCILGIYTHVIMLFFKHLHACTLYELNSHSE